MNLLLLNVFDFLFLVPCRADSRLLSGLAFSFASTLLSLPLSLLGDACARVTGDIDDDVDDGRDFQRQGKVR